jgi:hypothetical protein
MPIDIFVFGATWTGWGTVGNRHDGYPVYELPVLRHFEVAVPTRAQVTLGFAERVR